MRVIYSPQYKLEEELFEHLQKRRKRGKKGDGDSLVLPRTHLIFLT
jgi:hypothetical protein